MDRSLPRRRLHPITRTCRQLRIETLQPAWSQVNLRIGEFDAYCMLRRQTFASSVDTFIQYIVPTGIHLLRRATLDIRIRRKNVAWPSRSEHTSFQLRLRYSPSKGLELEPWNSKRYALTPASFFRETRDPHKAPLSILRGARPQRPGIDNSVDFRCQPMV